MLRGGGGEPTLSIFNCEVRYLEATESEKIGFWDFEKKIERFYDMKKRERFLRKFVCKIFRFGVAKNRVFRHQQKGRRTVPRGVYFWERYALWPHLVESR